MGHTGCQYYGAFEVCVWFDIFAASVVLAYVGGVYEDKYGYL